MKPVHRRYLGYICNIIDVDETISCDALQKSLRNYTPTMYEKRRRVFHHKDLPTTQVLSYILRASPNFEKDGYENRQQQWRRVK